MRVVFVVFLALIMSALSTARGQDVFDTKRETYEALNNSYVSGDYLANEDEIVRQLADWCEQGDGLACWYRALNLHDKPGLYEDLGTQTEVRSIADSLIEKAKPLLLRACEEGNAPACREGQRALVYDGASYRYLPAYKVDWESMDRLRSAYLPSLQTLCTIEKDAFACLAMLEGAKETNNADQLQLVHEALEAICLQSGDYSSCVLLIEADALLNEPKFETFVSFVGLLRTACAETENQTEIRGSTKPTVCPIVEALEKGERPSGFNEGDYQRSRRISADPIGVFQKECSNGNQQACDDLSNMQKYGSPTFSRYIEKEYRKADAAQLQTLRSQCDDSSENDGKCRKYYSALVRGEFALPDPIAAFVHARDKCNSNTSIEDFCFIAVRNLISDHQVTSFVLGKDNCDHDVQGMCAEQRNSQQPSTLASLETSDLQTLDAMLDQLLAGVKTGCFQTLSYRDYCRAYYEGLIAGTSSGQSDNEVSKFVLEKALSHSREVCYSHHQGTRGFCDTAARVLLNDKMPADDRLIAALPLLARVCVVGGQRDCKKSLKRLEDDSRFQFSWDGINDRNSHLGQQTALNRAVWNACLNFSIEIACQAAVSFPFTGVVPSDTQKQIIRRGCDEKSIDACILETENNLRGSDVEELFKSGDAFTIERLNQVADVLEPACENGLGKACFVVGDLFHTFRRSDLSRDDLLGYYVHACQRDDYRGCLTMSMVMDSDTYGCVNYGVLSSNCKIEPEMAAIFNEEQCRYWNGRHTCSSSARYFDRVGNSSKRMEMLEVGCPSDGDTYIDQHSCLAFAELYRDGRAVRQDFTKAHSYAKRACQKSVPDGCLLEADLSLSGKVPTLSKPFEGAFDALEKACLIMGSREPCLRALDLASKGYGSKFAVEKKLARIEENEKAREEACKDPDSTLCFIHRSFGVR